MNGWIPFGIMSLILLWSALRVVTSTDLVRSVLWLAVTLVTTAALFVGLHADFIAAVQILLYTGGVITLMLFAIMLTRRLSSAHVAHQSGGRIPGGLVALSLLGVITWTLWSQFGTAAVAATPELVPDTQALGKLFLTRLILPFEALSVLLLAAMIGAIAIARRTDP